MRLKSKKIFRPAGKKINSFMNTNYLIILLNYNNWQDTIECIHSLKNSGVIDLSILVIENCSSDESLEKLRTEAPGVKIIESAKNLGFTGGNNLGIKYALDNNYKYAILLNNDTIVEEKDSFQKLTDEMDKNDNVTIGTGRIFYYPQKDLVWFDGGKLIKWKASAIHYNFRQNKNDIQLNNKNMEIDFISGCFMCIRLKDFSKLGYMDENFFIYLDDIEYSARAIKNNLKLMYFHKVVIYHKALGEGKRTPKMIYYTIRNRRLLINLHFGFIAKIYFKLVLFFKKVYWFFTSKKYYYILIRAVKDYKRNYFGQVPEFIK